MTREKLDKLNQLLINASREGVITTEWLEKHGINSKLAWWYVHSGYLERVGSKAYKIPSKPLTWFGVLATLQQQLKLPIHIGGKTALQLMGRAHFIPLLDHSKISLFIDSSARIPSWMDSVNIDNAEFEFIHTSFISDPYHQTGLVEKKIDGVTISISSPERAALEMLFQYPKNCTTSEVMLLFENLNQLRPKVVQELLENCKSIKVARLFLYFTERFHPGWFSLLNTENVNLGSGKRVIGEGGKYIEKYKISLPVGKDEK